MQNKMKKMIPLAFLALVVIASGCTSNQGEKKKVSENENVELIKFNTPRTDFERYYFKDDGVVCYKSQDYEMLSCLPDDQVRGVSR